MVLARLYSLVIAKVHPRFRERAHVYVAGRRQTCTKEFGWPGERRCASTAGGTGSGSGNRARKRATADSSPPPGPQSATPPRGGGHHRPVRPGRSRWSRQVGLRSHERPRTGLRPPQRGSSSRRAATRSSPHSRRWRGSNIVRLTFYLSSTCTFLGTTGRA